MELTAFSNLLGAVGLGAASGLNPWIPLLGLGIAARTGAVTLTSDFDWLSSTTALVVLGVLFLLDLVGDKVPVVDHGLHLVGVVVAPVSGGVVFAAQAQLLEGSNRWLAAAVGMVLAGTVHAGRSAVRPAVTATTGGAGNPVVSVVEDAISVTLTVLAVVVPVLSFVALVLLVVWVGRRIRRWRARWAVRSGPSTGEATGPP